MGWWSLGFEGVAVVGRKIPLLAWLLRGPPRPGKSNGLAEGQEAGVLELMRQLPHAPLWTSVVGRRVWAAAADTQECLAVAFSSGVPLPASGPSDVVVRGD